MMQIKLKNKSKLPTTNGGDVLYNILTPRDINILSGETVLITLDMELGIGENQVCHITGVKNSEILVFPQAITVEDSGPVDLAIVNVVDFDIVVKKGDPIAKMFFHNCIVPDFNVVDEFDEDADRFKWIVNNGMIVQEFGFWAIKFKGTLLPGITTEELRDVIDCERPK